MTNFNECVNACTLLALVFPMDQAYFVAVKVVA